MYLLGDHLGSTAFTADGTSGAKLSELRYKPWGEVRYVWGATMTGYRYTGQRMEGTGLYDYGGGTRWYDPMLGRWTSPDSIVPLASQGVQAWDRYAFVNNNALRYNDPSGHDVGCSAANPDCLESNGMTPQSQAENDFTLKPPYKASPTANLPATAMAFDTPPTQTTAIPGVELKNGNTTNPTPSPVIEAPHGYRASLNIDVNWDRVDPIDLVLDGVGIFGGIVKPLGPFGAGTYAVSEIGEVIGTLKAGVDLFSGDPTNAITDQTITTAQEASVLIARGESLIPVIGVAGNVFSLYMNLRPTISIQYDPW